MTSCSQSVEIEDFVLETLEPARAGELREHVATCAACRREVAAVTRERALFARRAATVDVAPEAVTMALRARWTAEIATEAAFQARPWKGSSRIGPARRGATRFVRRGAVVLGRVLRRGHVSAAGAALLFALVAFSKLGGTAILPPGAEGASRESEDGPRASFFGPPVGDETLACSVGGILSAFDTPALSVATTPSSSYGVMNDEVLACGRGGEGEGATCESSVTCSSMRQ